MFTNPVAGFIPNSEFVYSTTTVNADDVNCTNLTATNANITNLVTTTFSPVNINGNNLSVVTATIGTATIGNADISNENVITSHITNAFINNETVGNINLNAMYINDLSIPGNKSKIYRDGNITQFEGRGIAGTEASSFEFRAGNSGPPALLINNNNTVTIPTLDVVEFDVNEITANSIISTTSTVTTENVSQLNVSTNATIQDLNVTTNIDTHSLTASGVINCNGLEAYNYINTQNVNGFSIFIKDSNSGNIKYSYIHRQGDILKFIGSTSTPTIFRFYQYLGQDPLLTINSGGVLADISQNLASGDGISLSTEDGVTTITNTKQVNDPLTINTLNSTTINNSGHIYTDKLVGDISENLIGGDGIFLNTVDGITEIINTKQVNDPLTINTLNSTTINNIGTITSAILNGNISSNLIAGDGIELLTSLGKTTINNTFALGSSTQYAFNAFGTSNSYQYITAGVILIYDLTSFCVPVHTDYNKGLRRYNVTTPGIYSFSYRALPQDYTSSLRIGIYKNAVLMGSSGAYSGEAESLNVLIECVAGDYVDVRGVSGGGYVYMSETTAWFNGYLLQPKNNTISAGTNLTITSLIATGSINGNISGNLIAGNGISLSTNVAGKTTITNTGIVTDPLNVNTINSTTINNSGTIQSAILNGDISNNLVAGENIILSTTGGLTTITGQAGGGLSTSTQYAFQVTSSSGGNVSYSSGGVLNFNQILLCIPSTSNYNTTNKSYVVQVAGYYQFGFKLYLNSSTTTVARFGIYKNSVLLGMGGAYLANAETITVIALCAVGDLINVKCEVGTNISIYMAQYHTWFYGYLLQPKNNTIDSTTNLLLNELNATTSIYTPSGIIDSLTSGTLNILTNLISPLATITTLNTTNLNSATITTDNIIADVNITSPASTITNLNTTSINNSGTITSNVGNIDSVISSNIDTLNLTSSDTITADRINMSLIMGSGIILTNSIFSPLVKGDQLRIMSSDPITYGDASFNKFNNTVNCNAGDGVVSGIFKFSTNAINYNMVYDGNLNISTEANITTGNITTLNSDSITADINITSPAATITSLNSTNITSDNATITSLTISSLNYTPNFYYASYSSTIPLSGTIFTFAPGTITTNSGFTNASGVVTVADQGYYRISAQINYQNNTTIRMSGELASAINGTEQLSYPKGYSYARGSNEGRYASSCIADWIVFLNSGQNVRFYFSVALGTSTSFTGTLVGINSLPGGYISITKIS